MGVVLFECSFRMFSTSFSILRIIPYDISSSSRSSRSSSSSSSSSSSKVLEDL